MIKKTVTAEVSVTITDEEIVAGVLNLDTLSAARILLTLVPTISEEQAHGLTCYTDDDLFDTFVDDVAELLRRLKSAQKRRDTK